MGTVLPPIEEDLKFLDLRGNRHLLDELRVVLELPEKADIDERRHYLKLQNTFKHMMGNYCQNTYVPLAYALAFTEEELKKEGKLDCLQVRLLSDIFEKRGFKVGQTAPYRDHLGYSDKLHAHFNVDPRTSVMNTAECFQIDGVLKEKVTTPIYDGRTHEGVKPLRHGGSDTNTYEVLNGDGRVILALSFAHGSLPPQLEQEIERIALDCTNAAEAALHTQHIRDITDKFDGDSSSVPILVTSPNSALS